MSVIQERVSGAYPRRPRLPFGRILTRADGTRKQVRLYRIWDSMWKRCTYPLQNRYERYGGRGITICPYWEDYANFRAWAISNGYTKNLTLDRYPNKDGNYEPTNCRWTSAQEQQWNTHRTIFLSHNGVRRPLAQWALMLGFTPDLFRTRRLQGWTDEQIILTPKGSPRIGYTPKPRGRKPKSRTGEGFSSEGGSRRD